MSALAVALARRDRRAIQRATVASPLAPAVRALAPGVTLVPYPPALGTCTACGCPDCKRAEH